MGHVCNQEASINGDVVFVGIDVDDTQFLREGDEMREKTVWRRL